MTSFLSAQRQPFVDRFQISMPCLPSFLVQARTRTAKPNGIEPLEEGEKR